MESITEDQLMELAVVPSATSYGELLEAQRELLLNQMEKLQELVAVQCKLTGVNPLSQEMAAGALSIKIGKRPRDLMNPKAIKYMQYVFSIKDSISKRETREISARFGVTSTQVRDFFTGQRSRVRKLARLSGERSNKCDLLPSTSGYDEAMEQPIPLNTIIPSTVEEGASNSKGNDILSEVEKSDLHFTKNIFSSMRKEESYGEQVKLLRWILRIKNPSVLDWFLIEGGLLILATWVGEAAKEEQTSYLKVIMKVLHYLPLRNALPAHVSAVLQSINKLRFYRLSDISHRARVLLSHWSKIFGKSLSSKKNNGPKSASDLQDEMLLKQSIREVMDGESWDFKDENAALSMGLLCDNPDKLRKSLPAQPLKLLAAPADETDKKRGVLPSYTRERRKVQILEQPGQKATSRNAHSSKTALAPQSRPLSADDIQKAKMRAQFMQSKYGKAASSAEKKTENQNGSSVSVGLPSSVPKSLEGNQIEEEKKIGSDESISVSNLQEVQPPKVDVPPPKTRKKEKILWRMPLEIKVSEDWHVATGESSKEVEVQNNRTRREREVIYRSLQEIPSNPREPWDREMDHDDSLTPQIPIEQLPDIEPEETPSVLPNEREDYTASVASTSSAVAAAPDPELLTALLLNPDLVFALTSGKVGAVSSEDIVKLLDVIKSSGQNLTSNAAALPRNTCKVEVSLPSPTPSSSTAPNGLKPELPSNPFSRQHNSSISTGYLATGAAPLQGRSYAPAPVGAASRRAEPEYGYGQLQQQQQWDLTHHHISSGLNSSNTHHLTTTVASSHWAAPSVDVRLSAPPARAHHIQLQTPNLVQSSYLPEHLVPSKHQFQNNQTLNNYRIQPGGGVVQGNWSPESHRQHEYLPGQYYNQAGSSLLQGQRPERASNAQAAQQQHPFGYRDPSLSGAATRRWPDRR